MSSFCPGMRHLMHPKASKRIRNSSNTSEHDRTHPNMSEHIPKLRKTSKRSRNLAKKSRILKKLVFAKIYSIWLIGFCLLFITLIIQFIFNSSLLDSDTIFRLILLIISYNIYYLIIINLSVAVSLLFKNSTSALSFATFA